MAEGTFEDLLGKGLRATQIAAINGGAIAALGKGTKRIKE
jgi:hypothetical protein